MITCRSKGFLPFLAKTSNNHVFLRNKLRWNRLCHNFVSSLFNFTWGEITNNSFRLLAFFLKEGRGVNPYGSGRKALLILLGLRISLLNPDRDP